VAADAPAPAAGHARSAGRHPLIETLSERSAAAAGLEVKTRIDLRDGGVPRLAPETETTV
jgi:hypothetical protein